jgi:thiol-disulfide isomerase/thioredoxin
MKFNQVFLLSTLLTIYCGGFAQFINGKLNLLQGEQISLMGFEGFKTYTISSTMIDANGNFSLSYSNNDIGAAYLISSDEKAFLIILNGENISLMGEALVYTETIRITKGTENQIFELYAKQHPKREQALSAWVYLKKLYAQDSLFSTNIDALNQIQNEINRILDEDESFLESFPKESYARWFIEIRKLVESVPNVVNTRQEAISVTINAFRDINYADHRLFKSGLLSDVLESHFWLIENSGIPYDLVNMEMKHSIDVVLRSAVRDEKKFNEITRYLFSLFEKHSLFEASEYLALKVLNEVSCTIDSDLAKQLESYRAMKKGNIAPEITFGDLSYFRGTKQNEIQKLSDINTQFTLVIFGASWCQNCNEELPRAIQFYNAWRKLGVDVVFISLDTDPAIFAEYIKVLPFLSYCDFLKWDSPVVQDYHVFGTPSMFLLNQQREIILRPNSIEHFNAWVDWFLVQGTK